MAAGGHIGCPKITFDCHISDRYFFWKFLTKWLLSAILDVRNSLSIAFLAILDRYGILLFFDFFYKMAAGGHFGCSKITFYCISGHFRSIAHFGCLKFTFDSNFGHFRSIQFFFSAAILDFRKSLSILFLAISDRSAILDVLSMAFLTISDPCES